MSTLANISRDMLTAQSKLQGIWRFAWQNRKALAADSLMQEAIGLEDHAQRMEVSWCGIWMVGLGVAANDAAASEGEFYFLEAGDRDRLQLEREGG